ncbi:GntR domain protein [Beutenbergia cavernae DSM 12333]|uniref:GntR domain protein n=2 Tax=Beutenbergia TaxID=84756 RepID=C5BY50_BEUC1|nr:GntR domain protein [Beutenbergia cavernae DSM 12333]
MDPVVRKDLSAELADRVVRLIAERGLQVGESIDSVRTLATRFEVAVPTVREALRRLEGLGILEFRHGSGIYVGPNAGRMVLANTMNPPADVDQLVELLEARLVIEPGIAELAARAHDAPALQLVEETLAEAERCLETGAANLWHVNMDLHRAIARATGNAVLGDTMDTLAEVHGDDQRQILRLHGDPRADFDEHRAIVDLIAAGDGAGARDAMHTHLEDVVRIIRSTRTGGDAT